MPEPARPQRQQHQVGQVGPGERLHLAVALDGAGWHPAAWREPDARPGEILTAGYWADLAAEAERGLLDFITVEDSLGLPGDVESGGLDSRTGQPRGRLDAVLIAARIAPLTSHVGIVPTVTTTHTEPFHVSTALATLDYVSAGRAGWQAQPSPQPGQARHFGRGEHPADGPATQSGTRASPGPDMRRHFAQAADFTEVVRRLWDSWEDDAVIRDAATGRFVDRDKLHHIDFEGPWFSVRGPSITPRPPQGQLPVAVLAHTSLAREFAATAADIVFLTPASVGQAAQLMSQVRSAELSARRSSQPLAAYADLVVFLDEDESAARERKERLDRADGAPQRSDAAVFTGTAGQLAALLLEWQAAGLAGFRLRPGAIPHDLERVTRALVPELQARGVFPAACAGGTLRERLGLGPRPVNRYATELGAPA
jgi:alkanesulfonate monooxygenase SsuD/methylene tetrahydromethanopterin reductase-like flavin-dependent oxidoreductase (luciferase family)